MNTSTSKQTRASEGRAIYTKGQARALRKIVRRIQDAINNPQTEAISELTFKKSAGAALVSVSFRTRRNDCDRYSPRAVMCESSGHLLVGPRGKIEVCRWDVGLHDSAAHNAFMLTGRKAVRS